MATYSDYNKQISDMLGSEGANRQAFQTNLETQQGLPTKQADLEGIRRSAMETDKLLADLPTQLKQRTGGMLMTSGQLGRQQAVETAPLANTLANLNRRESVAQTGISSIQDMINRALAQRNLEQGNIVSELQKQRDLAYAQEQADAARRAAGGGGSGGYDLSGLYGDGTPAVDDYSNYEKVFQNEQNTKRIQDYIKNLNLGGTTTQPAPTAEPDLWTRIKNINTGLENINPLNSVYAPTRQAIKDVIKSPIPKPIISAAKTIKSAPSALQNAINAAKQKAVQIAKPVVPAKSAAKSSSKSARGGSK